MTSQEDVEVAIIGAGIVGIATAYYLCTRHHKQSLLLLDYNPPMSFTSAQSGDNYRNWWPHPVMTSLTNYSIDLMEQLAQESSNVLNMTRRGYALATRDADIDPLLADLYNGYRGTDGRLIRIHTAALPRDYQAPHSADWSEAPDGVDVLSDQSLIRRHFPQFSKDIANVIHIRRAGDFSGQLMAQHMLARISESGARRLPVKVRGIRKNSNFTLDVEGDTDTRHINAEIIVNAAGPFAGSVASMLDIDLPIENVFQQKLLFNDHKGAVPRQSPFSVDLDRQKLDWTEEERELLAGHPDANWLIEAMPGGTHCRPEGGDNATWVKLGWAYNTEAGEPLTELQNDPNFDPQFPEFVLRSAWALNPALKQYSVEFPTNRFHYGGYYTMTPENWPLIGPLGVDGAFIVSAMSGFGSMAACGAGALGAAWVSGADLPEYANQLSLARYDEPKLIDELRNEANKGLI